jgi:cytochrome c biogenesis protein CcdA
MRPAFWNLILCSYLFEQKGGEAMKRVIAGIVLIVSMMLGGTMAFANPAMLPAHPGYPMSAAKSPITGQPVANDPGEAPPRVEESLKQASA